MKFFLSCFAFFFSLTVFAQSASDEERISIKAILPTDVISSEAAQNIETRMQRMLTNTGFADNDYSERFVLTAKIDVIQKDIVPSTPTRISEKIDITFMVGDIVENKIYASSTVSVTSVGTTEDKVLISAFSKINPDNKQFVNMLAEAKTKIVSFYTNNYKAFIAKAKNMAVRGLYDEAISTLLLVPNVCNDCYEECQQQATTVYQQKIDAEALTQIETARNIWMVHKDVKSAAKIAECLSLVSLNSTKYDAAVKLRNEVAEEMKKLQQREWNFQMKRYKDSQNNKRSLIKACRDVAIAWANNQPKSITRNIVRGLW